MRFGSRKGYLWTVVEGAREDAKLRNMSAAAVALQFQNYQATFTIEREQLT